MSIFLRSVIVVLAISFGFVGCKKNDDKSPDAQVAQLTKDKNHPLPATQLNDFVSQEAQSLISMANRASSERKNLVVISGAAWCGPCAQLDASLKAHPEVLINLKKTNIVIHVEEVHLTAFLMDVFPFTQNYWPMVLFYRPDGFRWSVLSMDENITEPALSFEKSIVSAASESGKIERLLADYNSNINNNIVLDDSKAGEKATITLADLAQGALYEKSPEDAKAIVIKIISDRHSKPQLFPKFESDSDRFNWGFYQLQATINGLVGIGAWTYEQILSTYPEFSEALHNELPTLNFQIKLLPELQAIRSISNNSSAAKQCGSKLEKFLNETPATTAGLNEFKIKMTGLCQALSVQAGIADRGQFEVWIRGHLAAMNSEVRASVVRDLSRYASSVGLFSLSQELSKEVRALSLKHRESELADMNIKLKTATQAGDKIQMEELRKNIHVEEMIISRLIHVYDQQDKAWASGHSPSAVEEL